MGKKAKKKKYIVQNQGKVASVQKPVDKYMDGILIFLIAVVVVLIPAIFTPFTFDPFDIVKNATFRVIVAAMFVLLVAWLAFSREQKIKFHPAIYPLLAFVILASVATYFSVEPLTSIWGKYRRYEGLVAFFAYALFVFLAIQGFKDKRRIELVSKIALWGGGLISFYGIAQYLGYDFLRWGDLPFEFRRSFASLGNPALLAGYLVTIVPLGVSLSIFSKRTIDILLNSASTILVFICLITTFNRTSWLAVVFSLLFLTFTLVYMWKRGAVRKEALMNLAIIVSALFIFFVAIAIQSAFSKATITVAERIKEITVATGSFQHRLEIWGAGFRMVAESPLVGLGPDTFRTTSRAFQGPKYGHIAPDVVADNAHNYELQIASGTGMLGFLFFAALVLYIFFEGWYLVFKRTFEESGQVHLESRPDIASLGVNLGLFSSFLAYLFQLLTSVSIIGSTVMWWFVFAMILVQSERLRDLNFPERKESFASLRWLAFGLSIMFFMVTTIVHRNLVLADHYYYRGRGLSQNPNFLIQGEMETRKAMSLNPWLWEYPADIARNYYRAYLQSKNEEYLNRAIEYAEYSRRLDSHESDTRALLVQLYILKGKTDSASMARAKKLAKEMVRDMPFHYISHLSLASVLFHEGDFEKATESLLDVVKQNPGSAIAYGYLAQAYSILGDKKAAESYLKKAIELDPSLKDQLSVETNTEPTT